MTRKRSRDRRIAESAQSSISQGRRRGAALGAGGGGLGNDDVEVGIELIHQPGQGGQRRSVADDLDRPVLGEPTGCGWLQHHADEGGFRPGDGQLRVGRRAFPGVEYAAVLTMCPLLRQKVAAEK
jgi:hypothetical protein